MKKKLTAVAISFNKNNYYFRYYIFQNYYYLNRGMLWKLFLHIF